MNIIKPSAELRSQPVETSLLETECLYGESIQILKEKPKWVYCRLLTDNYAGWLKKENLGNLNKCTHRVISTRSMLFSADDIKSYCISYIPMGSRLPIKEINGKWAETFLPDGSISEIGYIRSEEIVNINHKTKDWVSHAEKLIGTPYKWGGRNTLGIDCSALLQLCYQTYGEIIPRNTIDQINLKKETVKDVSKLDRGFVIFWEGHVGIMIDKINCIHANAYHMKTVIEPIDIIIERAGKNKFIKIMNFN